MSPADVAEVVGTNRNAANQMVHRARTHLRDALRARVLWRGGEPVCGDLADALAAAGVVRFDAEAVRVATVHADVCDVCERRRRLKLDPAVLFGAVPVVTAPTLVRSKVAHALAADGVPMSGSTTGADTTTAVSSPAPRRRALTRIVGAAAVVVLLALAGVVVVAEETDDGGVPAAVRHATTTSRPPATAPALAPTTTLALVEDTVTTPPPTAAPDPTPPTASPPSPPSPTTAVLSVTPATTGTTYTRPGAPVLAWQVSGPVAAVEVRGPAFTGTGSTGSAAVCPSASVPTWTVCTNPPGTYRYELTARAADGTVLASASATLTVP